MLISSANSAFAQVGRPVVELPPPGDLVCYTGAQRTKIAGAIVELEKCEADLANRNELIQQKLLALNGTPDVAWWQEPSFVWGGIVVGFAVGAAAVAIITATK